MKVGAGPSGPSPQDQTDQLSEGEWVEVGQEDCSRSVSLPATPDRELASVGSPLGDPPPSSASSVASGEDGPSGRAMLVGGRREVGDPIEVGAAHAPHGGSITISPPPCVAGGDHGSSNEGVAGVAEPTPTGVGSAEGLYVGPTMSSLDQVNRLGGGGPFGSLTLTLKGRDEYGGTDLEKISDGGVVFSEPDPPAPPSPTESEMEEQCREACARRCASTQHPTLAMAHRTFSQGYGSGGAYPEGASGGSLALPPGAKPPTPPSPTDSEMAEACRNMCSGHGARTGARALFAAPRDGRDPSEPRGSSGAGHWSPPPSDDELSLEELHRLTAATSRKRPISDTLAFEPQREDSPPGYFSGSEPEPFQEWQEWTPHTLPAARVDGAGRRASALAMTEDQWRPALEEGSIANEGWAGLFNPPVGSDGPGRAAAYSPEGAAVFTMDPHAMEDIKAGFDRKSAYTLPSLPRGSFKTEEQRADALRQLAIGELLPLLPDVALSKLLDGADSNVITRREAVRAIITGLTNKAGSAGANVLDVVRTLHFLQGYAESRRKWLPTFELWPMSAAVASTIISAEHARATLTGKGATGGQTCGDKLRKTLIFMGTHLGFPVKTDAGMVAAAAPSQKEIKRPPGSMRGAASLPMRLWIGLEWLAGLPDKELRFQVLPTRKDGNPPSEVGMKIARHYARSFVIMQLLSFRGKEMLMAQQAAAAQCAADVFAVFVSKAKDSMPRMSLARTEGFLGPLLWAQEHHGNVRTLGQFFPAFTGPHGVKTDMGLAEMMTTGIVEKAVLSKVLFYLWRSKGIDLSEAERMKMKISIHSLHGSPCDMARFIGPNPVLLFPLDAELALGFSERDCNQIGNWRRDKNGQPSSEAPPRRGQEPAVPAGAPDTSDSMQVRYSTGFGRMGDEAAQLRVRSRLVRIVAAAIRHMGDWRRLPKGGRESWYALFPDGDLQRVQEGINEENVAGDGAGGFTPGSSEPACA